MAATKIKAKMPDNALVATSLCNTGQGERQAPKSMDIARIESQKRTVKVSEADLHIRYGGRFMARLDSGIRQHGVTFGASCNHASRN